MALGGEPKAQKLSNRGGANQAHMEANSGTAFPHFLDLISLYQISEWLEPDHDNNASVFQEALTRVEGLTLSHDALILSQSNLALTIYRRLRLLSVNISNDVLVRIVRLGNHGLDAALRLAEDHSPWWHVANLPFQFICILLAIDTRESLSHIGPALCSFRAITRLYNTLRKPWTSLLGWEGPKTCLYLKTLTLTGMNF
ncbi:hypothetical protein PENFLA_c002G10120 [Penicillium flavigenum]|uniref:Transcription factor domain-containing protein n=1 Tax=Penicillium flavigenum TaxID=254877 RepID=A0A1V6TXT6_9EURO|nr:hypothetical protein PENFLA_c002G10120 [Penicillium flavigenum]